ncbi:MAG: outer membrane lipoprotein-sorting protein [Spirochaetes bacterium]|nr:outer membrane lipoprotein-sorting protein [Spirochaetota bacterium]
MKKTIIVLTGSFILAASAFAQAPDWNRTLGRIDEMGDFENGDFSAEITLVSQKPGEDDTVIQARYFRRDRDDKFVIVMLKPDVQRGQGYLSIGDDLWFYDPESRKFAFSSLKDSFQDSDAQNSDFSSSSLREDYSVESYADGKLGGADIWAAVLVAKDKGVAVPKRKLWIRKDNLLVMKEEHYSLSGRLMRTIAIPKYQSVSGKFVPASMLIVDAIKVGERTQITFASPSVEKLPDSVFTKTYLERVNQ